MLVKISVDAIHVFLVVNFNIFSSFFYLILVSHFDVVKRCLALGNVNHIEFNPSSKVPRSHLHASLEVVSIVLGPAYHRQHKMSLSQKFTLKALRYLPNDWDKNEIEKYIQHHVSPVAALGVGSGNTQEDDNEQSDKHCGISDGVVQQDLPSVVLHHQGAEVQSFVEVSEGHILLPKVRVFVSFLGVS